MSKQIIIIGGGISGLTVLHHLRGKYRSRSDVEIKLLEMNEQPGGTIQTVRRNGVQYECGPNGFLDSKISTWELAKELNLEHELIAAGPASKIRHICSGNTLHALSSPSSLFSFKLLSFWEKWHLLGEWSRPKGDDPDETVYEFGKRRLGEGFAKYFLEPLVSGVYGGDAKALSLRHAFPRMYALEQDHGSLLKGALAFASKPEKRKRKNLWSLRNGMGALIEALASAHKEAILCGMQVMSVVKSENGYRVSAGGQNFIADELILSVPAYAAADLLLEIDPVLAKSLRSIFYAPVVVVGLLYRDDQIGEKSEGFGYLRVASEGSEVLGVLFSSNIFSHRAPPGQKLFQLILGGARHPDTIRQSDEQLLDLARKELETILKANGRPVDQFLVRYGRGIPQYDLTYARVIGSIKERTLKHKGLHLLANYLDGVAINDCTANAKKLAESLVL